MRNFLDLLGVNRLEYAAIVTVTSVLMGGEAVVQPLLMKAIFDGVTTQRDFREFIPLGLGYLALGVIVNVSSYLIFMWRTKADNKIISDVSSRMMKSFYAISYGELLANGSGHYVARVRSDVKEGLTPMLVATRDMVVGIVSFLMLISVLIYISLTAFLVLVLMIPVFATISILISRRIRALTKVERDHEATIVDVLTRSIGALKIVKTFSLVSATTGTFTRTVDDGLEWTLKRSRMVRLLQVAGDLTRVTSDVSSVFVGAFLVIRHQMTVGSFIAFMNAFWRSSSTLFLVLNKWAETHSYASTIDRLVEFERHVPAVRHHGLDDRLVLEDVSFSYADAPVLDGISFAVEGRERILMIGENGSGKTTLANVLSGLLAPSEGRLAIPPRISSATLPTSFPPITVDGLCIDPPLLESLGLDHPEIRAGRPDFLSAGQQQKLAVALALSRQADLYVLDEPFANLDMHSRDVLLDEILRRTDGAMLIVIAHDPGRYAHHFDRVIDVGKTATHATNRRPDPCTIIR